MSGAPAVADDLLCAVAITAGPLLERVWKWNKVNAMMRVACTWLRRISPKIAAVQWLNGSSASTHMPQFDVSSDVAQLLYMHWHGPSFDETPEFVRGLCGAHAGQEATRPVQKNGQVEPWQPLLFHEGDDLRSFAVELRWTAQTLCMRIARHKPAYSMHSGPIEDLSQSARLLKSSSIRHRAYLA